MNAQIKDGKREGRPTSGVIQPPQRYYLFNVV